MVGVNTTGLEAGCNFATPINVAKKFLDNAVKNITRDRATMEDLGLTMKEKKLHPNLAKKLKINPQVTEGLLVLQVEYLSPSFIAGIIPGDFIMQVDGMNVRNIFEFVRCFRVGKGIIKIKIIRNHGIIVIIV